jgi:hypothetical protein
MVEPVIVEGEWRPESRDGSHFKLFINGECRIDYAVGNLFQEGRVTMNGQAHRMRYRYIRNTLICEVRGRNWGWPL